MGLFSVKRESFPTNKHCRAIVIHLRNGDNITIRRFEFREWSCWTNQAGNRHLERSITVHLGNFSFATSCSTFWVATTTRDSFTGTTKLGIVEELFALSLFSTPVKILLDRFNTGSSFLNAIIFGSKTAIYGYFGVKKVSNPVFKAVENRLRWLFWKIFSEYSSVKLGNR